MTRVRLAELLGSLSFAGDLGRGQPMGHVLRTTRIAMGLADRLRLSSEQLTGVYFTSLLVHAGCTAGAAECAAFLASDELSAQKDACLCDPNNMKQMMGWMGRNVALGRPLPERVLRMMRLMAQGQGCFYDVQQGCSDVGSSIATRFDLPATAQKGLYHICETWNGKGPHKLKGEDIPLSGRIVNVAMIMEVFFSERGLGPARTAVKERSGKSFDPSVAAAATELCDHAAFWDALSKVEDWSSILELEPGEARYVDEAGLDYFALALADIVDLKSPSMVAHSRHTAGLAEAIAGRLQLSSTEITLVRRAALAHDVGMVAVPSFLLDSRAQWSAADFERFRLHTYYTERILSHSEVLKPIGDVAAAHHENIDGSGYHRALRANQMSLAARIVATASAFAEASSSQTDPEVALGLIKSRRVLDGDCLAALASRVAGTAAPVSSRRSWPAGLTDREVEVAQLVASGLNLKAAAERLVISEHTARHHLEAIYGKSGVSSRAGLTLFAVENGLLS
jgi:HD-GYP domain-containing protein (c-di-GMP phosphodiesterase class II)/DNA-binding CsgD family transcriptional regulator